MIYMYFFKDLFLDCICIHNYCQIMYAIGYNNDFNPITFIQHLDKNTFVIVL